MDLSKILDTVATNIPVIGTAYSIAKDIFNVGEQRSVNQMMMEREDNAYQRRARDLKSAGINPIMAGGSPAGVSSLTPAKAESDPIEKALMYQQVINTNAMTKGQIALNKEKMRHISYEADMAKMDRDIYKKLKVNPYKGMNPLLWGVVLQRLGSGVGKKLKDLGKDGEYNMNRFLEIMI